MTLKAVDKPVLPPLPCPPLKLTLPEPATYPCSTNSFGVRIIDSPDMDSAVLSENKLARCSVDNQDTKVQQEEIPASIQSQKLLKDLSKEVRNAEIYLNSLNPPEPEIESKRESKREKRKLIDKDFVYFFQPKRIAEPVSIIIN